MGVDCIYTMKEQYFKGADCVVELCEMKDMDKIKFLDFYAFGVATGLIINGTDDSEAFDSVDELRKEYKKTL